LLLFDKHSVVEKTRTGILLDAVYNGERNKAVLYFLDPETDQYFRWTDKSNHTSYLLTDADPITATQIFYDDPDFVGVDEVTKYDAMSDKFVSLSKVLATNPNAIGGQASRERAENFRDILDRMNHSVWEARIIYANNFCYDMGYEMGMTYKVSDKEITPVMPEEVMNRRKEILGILTKETDYSDALDHWVRISEEPTPKYKYAAVDIEVLPETPSTMPNPMNPTQPVIAVSFVTSDDRSIVFILRRVGTPTGEGEIHGEPYFFDDEATLVRATFRMLDTYPFIITFNGDNFDLAYLHNRAFRLGILREEFPIYMKKKVMKLRKGVHIDLYPFIKNPSIQNYAFKEKYKNHTLEDVSMGLLGRGKIKFDKYIESLNYVELANYCINDSDLTYALCAFDNHTMFNLIISLVRMSNLSIYQVTRNKISDWVKSTMFYMMRRRNWLIPNEKDLASRGTIESTAKVKGKGYEGAIVRDPKSGIFFGVKVMDFASLYPSQVKYRNIGFSTVNCNHPECQSNIVPGLHHHICTKNRSLEADVIGGLRDIRVLYYKKEAKNKDNPQHAFYAVLEQAIKVYVNAAYGVFGSDKFALFCAPVAESIAAYSRRDITAVIDKAYELGAEVLYGDTDSVFLNNPTKEQVDELRKFAHDELKMDLDVDKSYRYALFSTRKKNYLGVYNDGTVDIKGLTGKKKQVPQIIKRPFYKVLEILKTVNNMEEYEKAKAEIWDVCSQAYHALKNKEFVPEDLIYSIRLSKNVDQYTTNAQHVKVARLLQSEGQEVRGGDNVEFIKAINEEGVMPLMGADLKMVDIETYMKELGSALSQILDAMDIDWDSVKGETTMDMFTNPQKFMLVDFMIGAKHLNTDTAQ
jgi:DNA polymerase I